MIVSSGNVPDEEIPLLINAHIDNKWKWEKYGLRVVSPKDRTFLERHQSYFKFMFVRNPYHRLLSAYRYWFCVKNCGARLVQPEHSFWKKVDYINEKFSSQIKGIPKLKGMAITFEAFLRYVLDDVKQYNTTDDHWKPLYRLSMPCVMNYDFIGKLETFQQDLYALMRHIGVVKTPEFHFKPAPINSTTNVFKEFWTEVPPDIVEQVQEVYAKDFNLFHYNKSLSQYFS